MMLKFNLHNNFTRQKNSIVLKVSHTPRDTGWYWRVLDVYKPLGTGKYCDDVHPIICLLVIN